MKRERLTLRNQDLAISTGETVLLGNAFAFVRGDRLDRSLPELPAWVRDLPARPSVVPLLGPGKLDLPGATVDLLDLPALRLAAVTSDKALYREARDDVHLLAVDPLAAGREAVLAVRFQGTDLARHSVRLEKAGVGTLTLRDLPAGDYEVRLEGLASPAPPCPFTVAQYRLAPLVARLVERAFEGKVLAVRIGLETFGVPVEGRVRLELVERERRRAVDTAEARAGFAHARFELDGKGPFAINVQLEADPSRTATLPLVGTRAEERARTTFSTLGRRVTGSLLPGEDARAVRGIFLSEGASHDSPFQLERVDGRVARLTAVAGAEAVSVVLVDPTSPPTTAARPTLERRDVAPGEVLELPVPGPMGVLAIGAFVEGQPWEGWAVVLAPDGLEPTVEVHGERVPGGEVTVEVRTKGGADAAVYLVVKDARLLGSDTPASLLAAQLKATAEATGKLLSVPGSVPAPSAPASGSSPAPTFRSLAAFAKQRLKIGEALVSLGFVTPEERDEALARQREPGARRRLGQILVEMKACDGEQVARAIAAQSDRKYAQLSRFDIPPEVVELIPREIAIRLRVVALKRGKRSVICAAENPLDLRLLDELRFVLGKEVDFVVSSEDEITAALGRYYQVVDDRFLETAMTSMIELSVGSADFEVPLGSIEAKPRGAATAPIEPARPVVAEAPEVLFAGLVAARDGRARATVRLGASVADYVVEAFAASGLDWASGEARFRAEKVPFVSLSLPAFVQPGDPARGRVTAGTKGRLRLRVTRNGEPVALEREGSSADFAFPVEPGLYEAVVEDEATGETDRATGEVSVPGKLRRLVRGLRFLEPGERISRRDEPAIRALRVLPGLERAFRALLDSTVSYDHACCEQTAAKILAAAAAWAFAADDRARRDRAEAAIVAGIRREATMWLPGRGWKMYPHGPDAPSEYLSPRVARYLWNLELLRELGPAGALRAAIDEGLKMAAEGCQALKIAWPPTDSRTPDQLYAVARFSTDVRVRERALAATRLFAKAPLPSSNGSVAFRADVAYASAALLRLGAAADRRTALALANLVVRDLDEDGRLYSTVDSVAAIALVSELRAARIGGESGRVLVSGKVLTTPEAVDLPGEAEDVEAREGVAAVEVLRVVEEDWSALPATVKIGVRLERDGSPVESVAPGDAFDLVVEIAPGYVAGDLVWVSLPDAVSRVVGGGQVKRFSVDFAGRASLRVALAATGVTGPGFQRVAVCLRNMFEEERVGWAGLLPVSVRG